MIFFVGLGFTNQNIQPFYEKSIMLSFMAAGALFFQSCTQKAEETASDYTISLAQWSLHKSFLEML